MIYTKYNAYRKYNNKPKYIIQILDIVSLRKRKDLYNIEQFIPYLNEDIIANSLKGYIGFGWGDFNIPLFKYMGKSDLYKVGLIEYFNLAHYQDNYKYKGYASKDNKWDQSFD